VSRSTVSKSFYGRVEVIAKIVSIGLRRRPWLPAASDGDKPPRIPSVKLFGESAFECERFHSPVADQRIFWRDDSFAQPKIAVFF
jgi:hypothetical protein